DRFRQALALHQRGMLSDAEKIGSSAESVGGCRFRQIPKYMILGNFCDVGGPKPVGFCHGQFSLVVQATMRAVAKRLWTCGQRKRVAHMPTATTTDAEAHQCWISKQAIPGRTHTGKTRQTTHRFRRGGRKKMRGV